MESVEVRQNHLPAAERAQPDARIESWMEEHGSAVLRLAFVYLLNPAQAEDVFQEVFLKAYRHAGRLQDPAKVRPWLLQVTANQCRDLRRSWWWRRILSPGRGREGADGGPGGLERLVETADLSPDADPAGRLLAADTRQALARAVGKLPDGYRETVLLHYFEGLSATEVAQITGVREGTVHSRLFRARQLLRRQLEEWGVEP